MKKSMKMIVAAAAVAACLGMPSVSSAVVIDDFHAGAAMMEQVGVGMTVGSQVGPMSSIIGGTREVDLEVLSVPVVGKSEFIVETTGGAMLFSNTAGVEALLELEWGAAGAGLGGIDLTEADNHKGFLVNFIFSDLGADMTVIFEDIHGKESSMTQATGAGANSLFFMFDDFAPTVAMMPADVTAIDRIRMVINAPLAGDYIINLVETATPNPEPATVAMSMMGLAGLGTAMRRRRTQ